MSTVRHNAPQAADVELPAGLIPAGGSDLDSAIRHFEATADALGAPRPARDQLIKMTHQVAGVTHELFPGKLVVETDVDPEMRDDVCLLFQVETSGTVEEILALNDAWARRVIALASHWPGLFCLFIDAH